MLVKHEKSKFTQRLNDIFKWSKEKIGSSKDNIDSVFEEEYAALLQEIECLANKQSCTISFQNENFSKPVVSSDEVSSLLKNHSSEVIDKYVRNHDKSKKYKNLTPEDFLTYLTEIIVTNCNNNECSCSKHKITLKKDGVKQENNKDVVKEVTPGKYEFDSQMFDEFKSEKDATNGKEYSNSSYRDRNASDASKRNEPQQLNGSFRSKNASQLSSNKRYSSELKSFDRGSAKQPSFGSAKPEVKSFNRSSIGEQPAVNEPLDNSNRQSVSVRNNGYEQKGCNHKLCTCKPFIATKEIATEQAKLSRSESIQADNRSTRLSKDKSAIINDNASLIGSRKSARQSFQATPTEARPKLESEGIQTSDCTINPNCYCCKKYATIPEEPTNGNGTKVLMKDQDTKMCPDTAVQTSRLCVPKNYEQLMQDPNMKFDFSNCPLEKKDCMCDAYDAKLAVERGWVLPSSEMCMQTGKKSKKNKLVKSDTDVTSSSSIEPPTKDQNLQFKGKKPRKIPPAEPTESELSTDDYRNEAVDRKAITNKNKKDTKKKANKAEAAKQAKKRKEEVENNKKKDNKKNDKKNKDKSKEPNNKKNGKLLDTDEDKFIKCPTCASDTSLNTVLEQKKKRASQKQVKYDDTTDTDTAPVMKSKNEKTAKKKPEKSKPKKSKPDKSKKRNEECEDEEEVSGCFGKKKKRPREKCEADCDAECNRAIQTKPPMTANKKDQANLKTESAGSDKKSEKEDKKLAKKASYSSVTSDASSQKTKTSIKSGSTIKCGKCGKEKKKCCQGCRNTIVVQPGSSRNLQDSNSLKLLIKMQAKDTNRRFDDLMTELNYQKTEIQRLNSMYQTMIHGSRGPSNNTVSRPNQDRDDNRRSGNNNNNHNNKNVTCCPCDEDRKRYGPEGTTVAINRCDVCHFDIARGRFPNFIRETYSRETYSDCCCGDCESAKCRKDMINQSRQHLHRKPFSYSNTDFYPPTLYQQSQDERSYEYNTKDQSQNTSYQKIVDKESMAANPPESDKLHFQRYNPGRQRIHPKTRIPYGQTSIADKNDIEERNRVLYKYIKPPVALVDIEDYNRMPQDETDPNIRPTDPRPRFIEAKNDSTDAISSKIMTKNFNEKDELLQNEYTFDSGKDSFPKSNDSCKDRLYTWLKSSWVKAEECQKKYREINKKEAATRRSKIKTGLLKMLRCKFIGME